MNRACKPIYTTELASSTQLNLHEQNIYAGTIPTFKNNFVRMKIIQLVFILILFGCSIKNTLAQDDKGNIGTHKIVLPDIPGFFTLKCDFHNHTVFSDGLVWPTIRVEEALKCGLDAIAITDHIEYQPFKSDVNSNHNRSNEIAIEYAKNKSIIVIPGTEITRDMPPGHCNALFIKDAEKLAVKEVMDAFKEAKLQGAFVFWNHPAWQTQCPSGIAKMFDIHKELIKNEYIQGIELANAVTDDYSDESFNFMLQFNLTAMCNSDIHGLGEWEWSNAGHRPVTLVFAKEKTSESIKEALFAGRTLAYYENYLIGKGEYLKSIFKSSLTIEAFYPVNQTIATVKIRNNSDLNYLCENKSKYTFQSGPYFFTIPAQSDAILHVKTSYQLSDFNIELLVHNLINAPGKGTEVVLNIIVKK
jgi:hypothetical protein